MLHFSPLSVPDMLFCATQASVIESILNRSMEQALRVMPAPAAQPPEQGGKVILAFLCKYLHPASRNQEGQNIVFEVT